MEYELLIHCLIFYFGKLILKGKSEFCRDVYSCPKYYHLKLETANPERLTNLLKYCIH